MSIVPFLSRLKKWDITFELVDNDLKIKAPKGRLTPDLIFELIDKKEAIIAFLHEVQNQVDCASIELVEEKEYYVLSSAQKRLYVVQQIEANNISYNIPQVVIIEGDVEIEKVQETFNKLIKRHASFRTSFPLIKGEPVQRVHKTVEFTVEYYESAEEEAYPIVQCFIRAFDLSRAPLLRVGLIKVGEARYIFMIDMHHIITDEISGEIFMRDFLIFFRGRELPELKYQYKDFSEWQNNQVRSGKIKKQEEYWLKVFEGEIPILNMPTDYPRPVKQRFEGRDVNFNLDKEICEKLSKLTKEIGTTMYMFLLAVFYVLLWKYTTQEDIVVGSPVMGRRHSDLENITGMFVGQLAMRNRPSGNKTFRKFLVEVKENALKAYENQDYQFDQLTAKLGLQGNAAKNPLFDVVFAMLETKDNNIEAIGNVNLRDIGGLKLIPYKFENNTSKTDLRLGAMKTNDRITLTLTYATALFKDTTCEKMMGRYIEILYQVIRNPDLKLTDIKISHKLSVAESNFLQDKQGGFGF